MSAVLLTLTVVLVAPAAFLSVRSIRRGTPLDGLAALVFLLGAGAPAVAYGALAA